MVVRFPAAALFLLVSLLCSVGIFFAIRAFACTELGWFLFALEFSMFVVARTTKRVKIIRVVLESVVLIFAAIGGLLPETVS